jgi:hypothetical protein
MEEFCEHYEEHLVLTAPNLVIIELPTVELRPYIVELDILMYMKTLSEYRFHEKKC